MPQSSPLPVASRSACFPSYTAGPAPGGSSVCDICLKISSMQFILLRFTILHSHRDPRAWPSVAVPQGTLKAPLVQAPPGPITGQPLGCGRPGGAETLRESGQQRAPNQGISRRSPRVPAQMTSDRQGTRGGGLKSRVVALPSLPSGPHTDRTMKPMTKRALPATGTRGATWTLPEASSTQARLHSARGGHLRPVRADSRLHSFLSLPSYKAQLLPPGVPSGALSAGIPSFSLGWPFWRGGTCI